MSIPDQVWFQLALCARSNVWLLFYIPPSDSPYFSHELFAGLHDKLVENDNCDKYVILGDVNARLGRAGQDIPTHIDYTYPHIPDDVGSPNDNAYFLASICKNNNLTVINNL